MTDTKQLTDNQIDRIIADATAVLRSVQYDANRMPDMSIDRLIEVHRDTFTWDTLLALASEVRERRIQNVFSVPAIPDDLKRSENTRNAFFRAAEVIRRGGTITYEGVILFDGKEWVRSIIDVLNEEGDT